MKMSKRVILPVAAVAILGLGTLGAGVVYAQATDGDYPPIVERIAEAFNLNVTEVQAVFAEERQERQQEMEAQREEHLAELVESGDLTQAQADALAAKQEEHRAAMDELRDSGVTGDERHEAMESLRADFEAWAEENGISLDLLQGPKGPRGGEFGGGRGEGMRGGALGSEE